MDKLVWINGMPRSGTSWIGQIYDSHPNVSFKMAPLFSYAFKDYVDINSSKEKWEELFKKIIHSKDEFINQAYRRESREYPTFIKDKLTHLVIKDTRYHNLTKRLLELFSNIKFVHIIRHPCGAINSWLKAPKEFPQHLNILEEWRDGKCRKTGESEFWGFNDWLYLTKMYMDLQRLYPENIKVVFYEKIVSNPIIEISDMFSFCNLNMTSQTKQFIKESQSRNSASEYAVFKTKEVMFKWIHELDPLIISEIKKSLEMNELDHYFYE